MGKSFVDIIRAAPPVDRREVSVIGIDPDIHVLGITWVRAMVGGNLPVQVLGANLSLVQHKPPKQANQHAITEGMCKLLTFEHLSAVSDDPSPKAIVIESQDFYPHRDMERAKMVSIANALISLATVSGALMGIARPCGIQTHLVAPKVWKNNRSKPTDHRRSAKLVAGADIRLKPDTTAGGGHFRVELLPHPDSGIHLLPPMYEHALDALGIALYGIEQIHRGIWT